MHASRSPAAHVRTTPAQTTPQLTLASHGSRPCQCQMLPRMPQAGTCKACGSLQPHLQDAAALVHARKHAACHPCHACATA